MQSAQLQNQKRNLPCIIGVIPRDDYPFKILLGPFESVEHAKAFKKRNRISKGFIRPADFFDHYLH